MNENITICGTVIEIIYQNADNGYTVCEIDSASDGLFTATGYMPYLAEGENISLVGSWTNHPDYGEQFKISYYETILPTDEEAILDYLSSGVIYGVRAATAKKIVDKFGTDSLDILLNDPLRLSEIKGISAARAEQIGKSYLEIQSMQSLLMFLRQYGLSNNLAFRVHQTLGAGSINMIKENPYILSERVDGISFGTADNIAHLRGIPKNSPLRIQSGIIYILENSAYNMGHTYLPKDILTEMVISLLAVTLAEAENGISNLSLSHKVYIDNQNIYLADFYMSENYIARRLLSISSNKPLYTLSDYEIENIIRAVEIDADLQLDPEQKRAVYEAVNNGVLIVTGGPGTGKTTTINAIIATMQKLNLSVALAAPTGRAAKRMSEVTGLSAKTIHRLLCVQNGDTEASSRFAYNETSPLPYDVIILDEVSMVDVTLMNAFLRAAKPGAKIIFSGDSDQLPSVGPGNILKDMIESGQIPVIMLKTIFRQSQESLIVMNAHKINNGDTPDLTSHNKDFFFLQRSDSDITLATIIDLYKTRIPKSYGLNPISSIQVLSPSKKGTCGSINLNRELQNALNPPSILKQEYTYLKTAYRVGDKVMQIKNNYDIMWERASGEVGSGIFNGDIGIIESISLKDRIMTIIFDEDKETEYSFNDLDNLDLAYATTVHKSQGSEFSVVIMPMCRFAPMLMCRNLLYTAVTRAKTMVILVGREDAVSIMVANGDEKKRYTGLSAKLRKIAENTEDK